jgi:class 3 adenylate cyclase
MVGGEERSDGADDSHIRTFLIADVRGYTVFTQEDGDEALAVFDSPRQAIRAAVELQRRFVDETVDPGDEGAFRRRVPPIPAPSRRLSLTDEEI